MGDKQIKGNRNGTFSSSLGFVIACVGSAVGLGNIWMFPYRVGQYGGAAFLIPYLLFTFLFGWVGLSGEFAIGRLARTGTIGSYEYCFARRGEKEARRGSELDSAAWVAWHCHRLRGDPRLGAAQPGRLRYGRAAHCGRGSLFSPGFGQLRKRALACGDRCAGGPCADVRRNEGDRKGEQGAYAAVFGLFLILAVWVAFLPGAAEGYKFLFVPEWRALLRVDTWVMAMGQAFFSLSITGSGMIVYGAYLGKEADIPRASLRTALFDTLAALLSGLAIMPAVFAYGVDVTRGPSLMFIALPTVFQRMPFGRAFAVFFLFRWHSRGLPR